MPVIGESKQSEAPGLTTEQAMNRVLEAEAQAQQHINEANREAEAILEQARQKAHHIQEHTDNRITRIHQRCNRWIADEVARIQQSAPVVSGIEQSMEQYELNDTISDNVVNRLAEILTSGE